MRKIIISMILLVVMTLSLATAVDLSGSITSLSGDPGSSVVYTLTLTNSGLTDLVVTSTSTTLVDASGHSISAPIIGSVTVPAASSASTTFTVAIPSTYVGSYTGTVTSVSGSNSIATPYTLTVNSKDSFTVSESSLTYTLTGSEESDTYVITNTGSTTLSSWSITFKDSDNNTGKILDSSDNEIAVTMTGASSSLAPGATMTITVNADPDSDVTFGSYSGTITMTATGSASTSATLPVSVTVESDICENGRQGSDFNIDIRNPDSGDDFSPGDIIPMEVKVENTANDDLDVQLEITLYNEDTGDNEKILKVEGSIDEDETETFTFDFELPSDLSENDDYKIYVQVHDEDQGEEDSCDYESVSVDITRESYSGRISQTTLIPPSGLSCNDDYGLTMVIQSTGDSKLTGAYVELRDADLDVSEETSSFSLGDYNDEDNDERLTFEFTIPEDLAAGTYSIEAILYDKDGDVLDSELIDIIVESCSAEDTAGDLTAKISEDYKVTEDQLTLALLVKNSGDEDTTITVTPEDVSWATLTGSEYLTVLEAGDEAHAYLYYDLDTSVNGAHDLKVTVTDDRGNTYSEIVTVDFGGADASTSWVSENAQGTFWIIADIILVILALVFGRMLFKKN